MKKEDMQRLLALNWKADADQKLTNYALTVAMEELGLLQNKNGVICYGADPQIISSTTEFRRYVSSMVFHKADTSFAMFSKWVIAQNERLFTLVKWEVMAKTCKGEIPTLHNLGENAALGWRFWAAFLGLGYLSGTMLIPNMKLRIQDILATEFSKRFQYGESIRAGEFVQWLSQRMPEVDFHGKLPLAFSAGIRTLQELGLIKLERWQDSVRVQLYHIDGEPINEFSHITVFEEVCR